MFSLFKTIKKNKKSNLSFPPDLLLKTKNSIVDIERLEELFYAQTMGINSLVDSELNPHETEAIKQLRWILKNGSDNQDYFPRLPFVLPKLINLLRDEDAEAKDIAALIESDPILLGDVMRVISSPYYKTRYKVTSLQQATVLLGRSGLNRLVANAVLKPLVSAKKGHFSKIGTKLLWDQADKSAELLAVLCKSNSEQQFYAYLTSVLQNLGFACGFGTLDKVFDGTYAPDSRAFQLQFLAECKQLTAQIAINWSMPTQVCQLLDPKKIKKTNDQMQDIARKVFVADKISKAQILGAKIGFDSATTEIILDQQPSQTYKQALDLVEKKIAKETAET